MNPPKKRRKSASQHLDDQICGLNLTKFHSYDLKEAVGKFTGDHDVRALYEKSLSTLRASEGLGKLIGVLEGDTRRQSLRGDYLALLYLQNRILRKRLRAARKRISSREKRINLDLLLQRYLDPRLSPVVELEEKRRRLRQIQKDDRERQHLGLPKGEMQPLDWAEPQPFDDLMAAVPPGVYGRRMYRKKLSGILQRLKVERYRREAKDPFIYRHPYMLLEDICRNWPPGEVGLVAFLMATTYHQLRQPLTVDTTKVREIIHLHLRNLSVDPRLKEIVVELKRITSSQESWLSQMKLIHQ